MSSQLGFLSEAGRDEPFDGSSARILCGVNPALRKFEPLDELSARIFVRSDPPHWEQIAESEDRSERVTGIHSKGWDCRH